MNQVFNIWEGKINEREKFGIKVFKDKNVGVNQCWK
jgi:hypothetical protein